MTSFIRYVGEIVSVKKIEYIEITFILGDSLLTKDLTHR